jgi:hypothetical protein
MDYITLKSPAQEEIISTISPTFVFEHTSPTYTSMGIQVASDPAFTSVVIESNTVINPTEWIESPMIPNRTYFFTFPWPKVLTPDGVFFWRVYAFDTSIGGYRVSEVRLIVVEGAAYPWLLSTLEFRPAKNGVEDTTEIVGAQKLTKHVFRITFAPMDETQMLALKVKFDLAHTLNLSQNESYNVWWGECERTLDGVALKPQNPEFGITPSCLKSGSLRWAGTAVFTER